MGWEATQASFRRWWMKPLGNESVGRDRKAGIPSGSDGDHIAEAGGNYGRVQIIYHAAPSDKPSVLRERETVAVTGSYGRYVGQGVSSNPDLGC